MMNTDIPIPPIDEQEVIIDFVLGIIEKIELQVSKVSAVIESLKEYRSALITNAVTGKIDVRDFKLPIEASHA